MRAWWVIAYLTTAGVAHADEPAVSFETKPGTVRVLVGGTVVGDYVYQDAKIPRPYFANLRTRTGAALTRTYPPAAGDPTDHATFHPGLWLAFGDLSGADNWRNKAKVRHNSFAAEPKGDGFTVRNAYLANDGTTVLCTETTRYSFLVRPHGLLVLWESEFRSDAGDFSFGDQEEMGLGVRLATPLLVKTGGKITNDRGDRDEKQVRGKPIGWCDYSAVVEGERRGVALFADPKNFRPSWVHARDYGLIVANPFGRQALTGGATSKVVVKKGEPFRLRYGVLLHAAKPDALDLRGAYKDYVALLEGATKPEPQVDFGRDVRPLLAEHCVRCHGLRKASGGLRLDVRRRANLGGDTGAALGGQGELLRRIQSSDEKHRMPPEGGMSPAQVATFRAWIAQGAPWPDELAGREGHEDHWAYRPVVRPDVPTVKNAARARTPIDAFLLAKLEKQGRSFAPDADAATLVRRLYLDLIGLPPTPEQVAAFAHEGIEKTVDRLLASPHFGERWGRHWLDLARFAESDGYENDNLRKEAWRWRDWVIDAVNRDMPYDAFTVEQLAGDLLPGATPEQIAATGMHRNTLWNSAASGDKEEFRTYAVKDRVDTTGLAWMGMTLGCARCHSHKYDPVSQREYYRLYAFFNNTDNVEVAHGGGKAPALRAVNRVTKVHLRGNFLQPGATVEPGTPTFLPPLRPRSEKGDRLDLARWLVAPEHPLTARVAVNHVWQHLFGSGLVPTPDNFGLSGEAPAHPEVLDWLATEFVRVGWSRKALLRTIVLSTVYRQASNVSKAELMSDPANVGLSRQNRVRVEAEVVRDLALSVAGLLDLRLGGPSIVPPFPEGLLEGKFTAESLLMPTRDRHRRGVYIHVQRTLTHPSLSAFDVADGNQTCVRRQGGASPVQALALLNDPVFVEAARALGARLRAAPAETRLDLAYRLCFARPPSEQERRVLLDLIAAQQKLGASEETTWLGVARTFLNTELFLTRE